MKYKHTNTSLVSTSGEVIVAQLSQANSFIKRLKGLIFTPQLDEGCGLLISPCKQVHTHFMRYALDIVFLDKSLNVVAIIKDLKPWRLTAYYKKAHYVLEVPANSLPISISLDSNLHITRND